MSAETWAKAELFAALSSEELTAVRPAFEAVSLPAGRDVIAEGDPGDDMRLGRVTASGHALYSTSPANLTRARQICRRRGTPYCLHLAEHQGEAELLATGGGAFAALLRRRVLPRDFVPPGCSPVAYARDLRLLGPETLAVHDGFADLSAGEVRLIGLPDESLRQNYLRAVRALRFAANYGLPIEKNTWMAILRASRRVLDYVSAKDVMSGVPVFPGGLGQGGARGRAHTEIMVHQPFDLLHPGVVLVLSEEKVEPFEPFVERGRPRRTVKLDRLPLHHQMGHAHENFIGDINPVIFQNKTILTEIIAG